MPMSVRSVTDERDGLLAYLAQQREAVRNGVHGLTDEQARVTPTASSLSLGGLLKHVAIGERDWIDRIVQRGAARSADWQAAFNDYYASFRLLDGETLVGWLDAYTQIAAETERVLAGIADLSQHVPAPAIWQGTPLMPAQGGWSVRWILLHLVEETARHAGHVDIVREQLDGSNAGQLMAAAEGLPAGWDSWTKPGDQA